MTPKILSQIKHNVCLIIYRHHIPPNAEAIADSACMFNVFAEKEYLTFFTSEGSLIALVNDEFEEEEDVDRPREIIK